MTETISLRIDSNVKKRMNKICNELGIPMTTVFNMFAKTIVREKKIPLSLDLNNHEFNEETKKAILNVKNRKNLSKSFNSIEELMEDLNA